MGIELNLNVQRLLEPYQEGGTKDKPVVRTLDTITSALVGKYKFPPHIVAMETWRIFYMMANEGLVFNGDGSYGSKGRELFSCIKAQCSNSVKKKNIESVKQAIENVMICTNIDCKQRTTKLYALTKKQRFIKFLLKPRGLWRL